MRSQSEKQIAISSLQQQIYQWEGYKQSETPVIQLGLGEIESVFPEGTFPVGAIHEFIYNQMEELAASSGFIGALLSFILKEQGMCLWISPEKQLYAPAIKTFGLNPDRIVFVHMHREKDILWALEEGLKCSGLLAVVAEIRDLNFVQSRRLQLAVEKSGVTGFVLHPHKRTLGSTTCIARWNIKPIPSLIIDKLPGIGFPQWKVDLLKVKNADPSQWIISWQHGKFYGRIIKEYFPKPNELVRQQIG
ncbi:ImuA family protein [Sphingobacterium suaedae]|uniref:ImuA family protein n=1 Tax=Sphingobacterium suaedae TaxID=1686402 RepID=A0ABW5KDA0_9SPHI